MPSRRSRYGGSEEDRHDRVAIRPLTLGLNDSEHPRLLLPGESPELLNVEMQRSSLRPAGGATKMNNQTAPRLGPPSSSP